MSERGPVLLTGATGFLGMEVLGRLVEQTDRDVIALVRAPDDGAAQDRLDAVIAMLLPPGGRPRRARVRGACGRPRTARPRTLADRPRSARGQHRRGRALLRVDQLRPATTPLPPGRSRRWPPMRSTRRLRGSSSSASTRPPSCVPGRCCRTSTCAPCSTACAAAICSAPARLRAAGRGVLPGADALRARRAVGQAGAAALGGGAPGAAARGVARPSGGHDRQGGVRLSRDVRA